MEQRHVYMDTARFERAPGAGKAVCEPGWRWQPKPLTDYDLWYVVSGRGTMRLDGREYALSKGHCFLLRPGDTPDAQQHPDDRLTVIFMHHTVRDIATGMPLDPDLLPGRHTFMAEPFWFELLLNRLLQCIHQDGQWHEQEFDLIMKQVMLHLFRSQLDDRHRSEGKHRQLIAKVIAYIGEDAGRTITHQELAELVQLSPEYVSVLFKKYAGISIKEYKTKVRLERAMHLLLETPMNVSQVADSLGYANVYLFSKQFKNKYGKPPSFFKWKLEPGHPHRGSR